MELVSEQVEVSAIRRTTGWLVHAFTASGACFGLLALHAIYQNEWILSLWFMGAAVFIDAVDGTFARLIQVKRVVPEIDGALLDNIIDFFNYMVVPCFFLMVNDALSGFGKIVCILAIVFSSSYQFTQIDAKTEDHFFKGFPSYWNIVIFYLYFWQLNQTSNLFILLGLAVLSFVPIKYVYPTRLDHLTSNYVLKSLMVLVTWIWGFTTLAMLWIYPSTNSILEAISLAYPAFYVLISVYRTFVPLD